MMQMNQIKQLNKVNYFSVYFHNEFVRRLVVQKSIYKFVEHSISISSDERKDGEFIQELKMCLVSDWRKKVG